MDTGKIVRLLQQCELQELRAIEEQVKELISKAEATEADIDAAKQRWEERFKTNILATLTRITDVRPGERKEFSATIEDISQSGMRLRVDTNFIPSRLVGITFAGPGGRIKRCYVKVVRMRKMADQYGSWLEVGCHSVSNQEVRRLRLAEERIAKMRTKVHHKKGISVVVVGPNTEETSKLTARIKAEEYQVRQIDSIRQVLESDSKTLPQLAVLCQGSQLCKDAKLLEQVVARPASLAVLAIVENEEHRFKLFQAGIDECLMVQNQDEFLFSAIERALIGHECRQHVNDPAQAFRALVFSTDSTRINLVSYQLEDNGFECQVVSDLKQAERLKTDCFQLVLTDFDAENPNAFKDLCKHFGELPVIALCEEMCHGHQAMANGAVNYLCMPPNKEEMYMILEDIAGKTKVLAAQISSEGADSLVSDFLG